MGTLISHFSSHLIQLAINQEILAILWRGGGGGGGNMVMELISRM